MKDRGSVETWGAWVVGAVATLSLMVMAGAPAQAKEYQVGKEGTFAFDSTLTMAASMRTSDRDCVQIASTNGGCNTDMSADGRILISDDGNLNVDQWDVYSISATMLHEIQYDWRNIGAFARVNYFYDIVQDNELGGGFPPQRTDLSSDARYRTDTVFEGGVVGRGFRVLDLYGYASFDFADRFWDLRLGNQLISWGEAFYTQGGVNATNALDVTKLRTAGSELKEGLVPAPMVRLQGEIIGGLGFDAYYQFYWNKTDLDPTGVFYSVNDLVARGAEGQFFGYDPGSGVFTADELLGMGITFEGSPLLGGIQRYDDEDPNSQGQWGLSLKYYFSSIETEFTGYYLRFHDKQPSVSYRGHGLGAYEQGYFVEYPEGIDLIGASFNTVIFGTAVSGELSYRDNQPTPITSAFPDAAFDFQNGWGAGEFKETHGFVREQRYTGIINGLYVVGPATPVLGPVNNFLGSDDMNIVAEFSVMHYPELDPENIAYAPPNAISLFGYEADDTAYGYVIRIGSNYSRAFGSPIKLSPSFTWKHDVSGTTPDAGASYTDGRKAVTLALEADYQNTWKAILRYANQFGGGDANTNDDRDFLQLSVSYAF